MDGMGVPDMPSMDSQMNSEELRRLEKEIERWKVESLVPDSPSPWSCEKAVDVGTVNILWGPTLGYYARPIAKYKQKPGYGPGGWYIGCDIYYHSGAIQQCDIFNLPHKYGGNGFCPFAACHRCGHAKYVRMLRSACIYGATIDGVDVVTTEKEYMVMCLGCKGSTLRYISPADAMQEWDQDGGPLLAIPEDVPVEPYNILERIEPE